MRIKKGSVFFTCMLAAALTLAAGCGKADPGGSAAPGSSARPQGTMSGAMGVVTQVGADSITIAVMPQGMGGNGGQMSGGSGLPDRNGAPRGSGGPAPTGGMPGPEGSMPAMDTSGWQTQTYRIDDKTKITQGAMQGQDGGQALTAADLKAGDSVVITERSGTAAVTADQITVTQGMGGMPGGPGGNPAPSAT